MTESFISKLTFWCTTLITLHIQIRAKGWLKKLLPLPLHDSLLAERKFETLLCRTPFLFFSFSVTLHNFYKYVKILCTTLNIYIYFVLAKWWLRTAEYIPTMSQSQSETETSVIFITNLQSLHYRQQQGPLHHCLMV